MLLPMSKVAAFWGRTLLASALILPASPGITLAAEGADSGWFDPQSPNAPRGASLPPPTPRVAPVAAAGAPQAVPGAPLPPSPLLDSGDVAPAPSPPSSSADRDPRALSDFRPALDPYGSWMDHPTYGTVWIPSPRVVGSDFSPYVSAGRWALDDAGNWVWMSDYPFGGVVFHYGRWIWVAGTGWAWVPGYEYAPAWVTWRVPTSSSYAYVGWAPMGPDYIWYGGYAVSFWYGVYTPWIYCHSSYVFHDHVHHHVVRNPATVNHLNHHTRSYVPANPSARVAARTGPPLGAARVPESARPRDRVPSTRPAPGQGPAQATFAQRARFTSQGLPSRRGTSAPAEAARFRVPSGTASADTSRFDSRPTPSPSKSVSPSSTKSRVPSTAKSFTPDTSSSRALAPRTSIPSSSSRSFSPSTSSRSFSPSMPSGGGGLPRGRR